MNNIKVPVFVLVITVLTSLIATVLGVWGWVSPETHTQYIDGAFKLMISWSARELGMGVAGLVAVLFYRDARAFAVVLAGDLVREVLDVIDFFRVPDTPIRFYFVVGTAAILQAIALYLSVDAIRKHSSTE
ncbi:hypothetical protein KFU94_56260 [Chloroflexi bacterium TSY]|nr:hypothetical protein [Chloroflexi bacterium TSY]